MGHGAGDDAALVVSAVVVRTDSAGCTQGFVGAARASNMGFFVVARSNAQVTAAIFDTVGLDGFGSPLSTSRENSRRGSGGRTHRARRSLRVARGDALDRAP